jgi:hypothetical protein
MKPHRIHFLLCALVAYMAAGCAGRQPLPTPADKPDVTVTKVSAATNAAKPKSIEPELPLSDVPPLPPPIQKPASPTPLAGGKLTVAGYIASPSEDLLDKAVRYASQKDAVAFGQLLQSGMVIQLKGGIPIEVTDTDIFGGKVKIRPRGQTIELWTVIEAVKDQRQ